MTPEAQRIAIAEACGWKWWRFTRKNGEQFFNLLEPKATWPSNPHFNGEQVAAPPHEAEVDASGIPDYLNSLDAMHAAEKMLQPSQTFAYIEHLRQIVDPQPTDMAFTWLMFQATAAQRAEAFLRTLGKWEDGK